MPRQFSYVVQRADLWPLLCRPNDDFSLHGPTGAREVISIVWNITRVSFPLVGLAGVRCQRSGGRFALAQRKSRDEKISRSIEGIDFIDIRVSRDATLPRAAFFSALSWHRTPIIETFGEVEFLILPFRLEIECGRYICT